MTAFVLILSLMDGLITIPDIASRKECFALAEQLLLKDYRPDFVDEKFVRQKAQCSSYRKAIP